MVDFSGIQQHLTAITTAQTDYAKSSFETSKAYLEKLAGVKSPDKFMELTMEHTKSAYETGADHDKVLKSDDTLSSLVG